MKGTVITDDIKGIIALMCIGFILYFLLYVSGVSITDITGLITSLLTELISGLIDVVVSVITLIFTAIFDIIKALFCAIPILNMVC